MEPNAHLAALIDLAEEVGIVIRRAPLGGGDSPGHPGGALVRLKGSEMLFLDPTAALADQIHVVAVALKGREQIENRFLRPEIRQLIEESSASGDASGGV